MVGMHCRLPGIGPARTGTPCPVQVLSILAWSCGLVVMVDSNAGRRPQQNLPAVDEPRRHRRRRGAGSSRHIGGSNAEALAELRNGDSDVAGSGLSMKGIRSGGWSEGGRPSSVWPYPAVTAHTDRPGPAFPHIPDPAWAISRPSVSLAGLATVRPEPGSARLLTKEAMLTRTVSARLVSAFSRESSRIHALPSSGYCGLRRWRPRRAGWPRWAEQPRPPDQLGDKAHGDAGARQAGGLMGRWHLRDDGFFRVGPSRLGARADLLAN